MYLSNRDIKWAIDCGKLIVDPRPQDCSPPKGYDETAIDLHLGSIDTAKIWDHAALAATDVARGAAKKGDPPKIHLGNFDYRDMAVGHLKDVPEGELDEDEKDRLVYKRGREIIVRQFGFVLWTTRERVGTPAVNTTKSPCTIRGGRASWRAGPE